MASGKGRSGGWVGGAVLARVGARLALMLAAAWLLGGCVWLLVGGGAAAAGAGAAIYYKGRLEQTLQAPIGKVHTACVSALKYFELPILDDKVDKLTGHLESQYADGKHVWIDLKADGGFTKVTIRVGLLGDEDRAMQILDRIKKNAGL